MAVADELRVSIRDLHAEKSAAYGPSWKKRGEVLGVLANLARKVDRLEALVGGAAAGTESMLDTATDLLIYCLKHQTLLADVDANVEAQLFGGQPQLAPYSDGLRGFEHLLLTQPFLPPAPVTRLVPAILDQFQVLEACYDGLRMNSNAVKRLQENQALAALAGALVLSLTGRSGSSVKYPPHRRGVQ